MCFNQLGVKLSGYKSGSIMMIRGRDLRHYVAPWTGKDRYAFDFTCHESIAELVRRMDRMRDGTSTESGETTNPVSGPKTTRHSKDKKDMTVPDKSISETSATKGPTEEKTITEARNKSANRKAQDCHQ